VLLVDRSLTAAPGSVVIPRGQHRKIEANMWREIALSRDALPAAARVGFAPEASMRRIPIVAGGGFCEVAPAQISRSAIGVMLT